MPPGGDLVLKNLKKQVRQLEILLSVQKKKEWCIVFKKRVQFFYQSAGLWCFVREGIVIVFSFEHRTELV